MLSFKETLNSNPDFRIITFDHLKNKTYKFCRRESCVIDFTECASAILKQLYFPKILN